MRQVAKNIARKIRNLAEKQKKLIAAIIRNIARAENLFPDQKILALLEDKVVFRAVPLRKKLKNINSNFREIILAERNQKIFKINIKTNISNNLNSNTSS